MLVGLLLLSAIQPYLQGNLFMIIFILRVVTKVKQKQKQNIFAALEWKVGMREGSAVKDIHLRLIFGEIRGICSLFCSVFISYHYILHIIKAYVSIVTPSQRALKSHEKIWA